VYHCGRPDYDHLVLAVVRVRQDLVAVIEISNAHRQHDIDAARQLFREYQEALGVDLSFQNFASELDTLPGAYAPPRGRLLLAHDATGVMGCVALRALAADSCEMKRLYVRPDYRASGLGQHLVDRVIAEARLIGYSRMLLDTLPTMAGAQRMYERFGFRDVPPYRHNPIEGTRFLGLDL
jgi:ribosomal protein S18 acetylase RimI-like enzyme